MRVIIIVLLYLLVELVSALVERTLAGGRRLSNGEAQIKFGANHEALRSGMTPVRRP